MNLRLLRTVQGLAEDEKPLIEKLRGEIQQHIHNCYQVFVPRQTTGQIIAQKGGQRREDRIIDGNLCHGYGHVGGGLEGKFPVQGKVPEYAQAQGNQVAGPVWEMGKFIQQGEASHFDETGADGEKGEFQDTDEFFHEYLQNHSIWSLRRKRKSLPINEFFCLLYSSPDANFCRRHSRWLSLIKQLGQHRINRQGGLAEDFVPDQSYKAGGILYVFPSFVTAEPVQKTRCDPQTHLCGVALIIL